MDTRMRRVADANTQALLTFEWFQELYAEASNRADLRMIGVGIMKVAGFLRERPQKLDFRQSAHAWLMRAR